MKKVLFVGVTRFNLEKDIHLKAKYEGLSQSVKPYVLAKGKLFHHKLWGADFYLLPPPIFWTFAPRVAFWLCISKKIDVVVSQGPLLEGLTGVMLKKFFKKELIVELHGDWEERKPSIRGILTFFAKISLRNADKIRGVANYLVDKAKKYAPDKRYFLFPTFTDLNDFLNEKDIRFDKTVLYVGREDRVKGIKYLKEAFSSIQKEFPEFKLVLVGDGLPEGKLPLTEVRERMKNCYCLVLPSLTEGLPRVILEAMALAKPVVASRVGGIPDIIQHGQNGFLVEPANAKDLADKLRMILKDQNAAEEMGRRGREAIKDKFSNEKYIENYLGMINS